MAATYPFGDRCRSGSGKFAQVYYIAGMPWAITDSPELATNITTAYRRKLFGSNPAGVTPTYPADTVQILTTLDPNTGIQTSEYDNKQKLKVGGWKVSFDSNNIGTDFSDYYAGDVFGLLGLDVVPRISESNVFFGELDSEWPTPGAADDLKFTDEAGLIDYVDTQISANNFAAVWMKDQCLGLYSKAGPTNGVVTYKAKSIFRSKKEYLFPTDADNKTTRIFSAPVRGIVGKPAWVFLVELDRDGTLGEASADPIMYRQGQVQANPSQSGETWTVSHTGLTGWLNVEVPNPRLRGSIRGFCLSRGSETGGERDTGQKPHFTLVESGSADATLKIGWLCAQGTTVYFDTIEDLADAFYSEIINENYSTFPNPVEFTYTQEGTEIKFSGDKSTNKFVLMSGVVPFILGTGYVYEIQNADIRKEWSTFWPSELSPVEYPTTVVDTGALTQAGLWRNIFLWDSAEDRVGFYPDYVDEDSWQQVVKNNLKANYFWQWDWSSGLRGIPDADIQEALIRKPYKYRSGFIPLPDLANIGGGTDLDERIFVNTDADVNAIPTDAINIGDPSNMSNVFNPGDNPIFLGGEYAFVLEGEVSGKGLDVDYGPAGTNEGVGYLEFTADATTGGHLLTPGDAGTYDAPIMYGTSLYYMPAIHDKDPWPLSDQRTAFYDKPSNLFKSLLGTTGLGMRNSGMITHIPDLVGDVGATGDDDRTLIDFDQLDKYADEIYPDATYKIQYPEDESQTGSGSTRIKLGDALNNLLFSLGLRATWEYRESQRAWMMGFAKIEPVNLGKVATSGRIFNESVIAQGTPVYKHAEQKVMESLNWTGFIESQLTTFNIESDINLAASEAIKIKDIIGDYKNTFDVFQTLVRLYQYFVFPYAVQKFSVTPKGLAMAALGREVEMDWRALKFPKTGQRNSGEDQVGIIQKLGVSLNKCDVSINIEEHATRGISPAFFFDTDNASLSSTTLTITENVANDYLSLTPADQYFVDPTSGLLDHAMFDCYFFNDGTNALELRTDCGCSNYRCTVFERGTRSLTASGASRNVWHGEITSVAVTGTGQVVIELDDATNFSDSDGTSYVVEFGNHDHADTQTCQKKYYSVWGDEDGYNIDSDGAKRRCPALV
jgi:hypothetical protein